MVAQLTSYPADVRRTVKAKAPLRVQLLLTFGGRGGGKGKKLGGREGSIESQQKFDFFKYDITPYSKSQFHRLLLVHILEVDRLLRCVIKKKTI